MIKILLVEDDAHKRNAIADAILSVAGLNTECLDVATDVADARQRLKSKGYDLLLLDIHLPKRADKHPEPAGGLEILRWLKAKGKQYRPPYIVGTTAYAASLELAQAEFDNLIWTVIAFSFSNNSWKPKLAATIGLICDQIIPPYTNDGITFRSDVLVVTALEQPEMTQVLGLPCIWTEAKVRFDDSRYFRAKYESKDCAFDIVAVSASDKGLSSAAIAATKAIQAFRPRYVFMAGICAGVRGRVDIGDVIVADPSWDWGSGKTKVGTDGEEFFHPAQYQMRLDESLRALAAELRAVPNLLLEAQTLFNENKPTNVPSIYVGALASGAAVLQSRSAVQRILDHHKDLKGIDMEVYSVMYACHIASHPRPKCIAAKAVCDFGDEEKGDGYQPYAAFMSAAFLFALLNVLFAKDSSS